MRKERKKLDEYIVEAEQTLNKEVEIAEKQKQIEERKQEQTELQKNVVAEYLEGLEIQKTVLAGIEEEVHRGTAAYSEIKGKVTEEQIRRQEKAKESRERAKKAKARTRRLIQEGAILESIFPELKDRDLEQIKAVLIKMRETLLERGV